MRLFAVLALSFAAVTMSFAQSSSRQVFPGANPAMPFAAAVKADGLVYVSGTLGSGGEVKAQTKQVLDNISATLKTAGSSLANAASVTVYLRNQSDWSNSPNPYSYGVKTGNTLVLSGLIARNGKDNTAIKGDMATQTKAVLENGATVLKAA